MKILYLITRAERGGGQVHVLQLIRGFRNHCDIELATGEEGFLMDEARRLGVNCHLIPSLVRDIEPRKDLHALRELIRLMRRTQPDLVHSHTSKAGILGRVAARVCDIPSVFTAHAWSFVDGAPWTWRFLGAPCERLVALNGGMIINVSEANRQLALRHRIAPAERLITIHNGVPEVSGENAIAGEGEARDPNEPPIVIMVARFALPKDQAMLLDAAAMIDVPFRIQFAGTGPTMAEVHAKAQQMKLCDRVEFLGDRSDIAALLRRASIFALPTNWEGHSISVLEGMRAGLPIVATNVGGVGESVTHGVNGLLTPRGDTAALAKALKRLLTDRELRGQMSIASRKIFEQRFTAEQMFRKTFAIYRQAVSGPVGEYEPSRIRENA
ncbi:MAG TPA: glycosyltransferase family 4 protein [Bryobacteraceae bacterium]|jgi:glycosyltransferase involved in cell wall biosynthesis|nr:glycosyltransferase family 4 protein [Bryobacteraceae bacterium]